jgi:hypothetical protein
LNDSSNKRKNIKNDQLMMALAGVLVIRSIGEMGKNEHCHEGTYEATPIVQACVPYVTGSYLPASMSQWNG